jgi:hypothetical protein
MGRRMRGMPARTRAVPSPPAARSRSIAASATPATIRALVAWTAFASEQAPRARIPWGLARVGAAGLAADWDSLAARRRSAPSTAPPRERPARPQARRTPAPRAGKMVSPAASARSASETTRRASTRTRARSYARPRAELRVSRAARFRGRAMGEAAVSPTARVPVPARLRPRVVARRGPAPPAVRWGFRAATARRAR